VKRLERLGRATAPDGTELTLHRRDGTYTIRAGGEALMSTRRHHSEEKLAELGCAPLRGMSSPRALIGGLGFGFTLRAALGVLPGDAEVVVAEIVPEIIEWNRNPDFPLAADALADPRVTVLGCDVAELLRESRGAFDAVLLDVDNGAEALTTAGNARLYDRRGMERAAAALRPGGRLAYWLAGEDPRFVALLRRAGLSVEVTLVRAHVTSGGKHAVVVARRA